MLDIRSVQTVDTPEGTRLELELAGVANRLNAFVLDLIIFGILLVLSMGLLVAVGFLAEWAKLKAQLQDILMTVYVIVPALLLLLYQFLQEWLWNGKTIGKHVFKIRVVRANGQPIGFWEAFGRHLMRLIDIMMMGVGMIPLLMTQREQRFGDLLVGTIVVNDEALSTYQGLAPLSVTLKEPNPALQEAGTRLNAEEYGLLQDYLHRRKSLLKKSPATVQLEKQLKTYFQKRLHLGEEEMKVAEFFEQLYQGYTQSVSPVSPLPVPE